MNGSRNWIKKENRTATEQTGASLKLTAFCSPVPSRQNRSGQSLVESAIVLGLLCLIFMGLMELARLGVSREILYHAAARGSRARTVGFNRWMVRKCVNVASIPNAGAMTHPGYRVNRGVAQDIRQKRPGELFLHFLGKDPGGFANVERARIPEYLAAENHLRAQQVLDYDRWDTINYHLGGTLNSIDVQVSQDQSQWLWGPVHKAYYAATSLHMSVSSGIENHYSLYLNDKNW